MVVPQKFDTSPDRNPPATAGHVIRLGVNTVPNH